MNVHVRNRRAHKVVLVEDSTMFDRLLEVKQETILHKLCLQKTLLLKLAVVKPRKAEIPEEIVRDLATKEVLAEVACEVVHLLTERMHAICRLVGLNFVSQRT